MLLHVICGQIRFSPFTTCIRIYIIQYLANIRISCSFFGKHIESICEAKSIVWLIECTYESDYCAPSKFQASRHLPLHHIISTQSNKIILIIILSIYWWQQTAERGWDDAKIAGRQMEWSASVSFHHYIWMQLISLFSAMLTILLSIHHFDNRSVHSNTKRELLSWHPSILFNLIDAHLFNGWKCELSLP